MTNETEDMFKALGNNTRLKIVGLLKDQELSCGQLQKYFELSQPTMSHHFSKLITSGVIKVRKDGASLYYSLNRKQLKNNGIII